MAKPQLTIITPVFNGIRFIESCIKNVMDQAQEGVLEHIIFDGGSTDGTTEVIKRYAEHCSHIRWASEPDRGQSDAMNKGVRAAAGQILGFLNVDDFYEPGVLREIVPMFERFREPTLLVGNCNIWDDHGKLISVSRPASIGLLNLLRGRYEEAFPMNSSAYFYHRSLHDRIGPYEVGEIFAMDIHFIFRAVQHANVAYVDKTFGNYRYLEGTRTFEDVKNGMNSVRVKKITDDYRRQQPAYIRAWLSLSQVQARILRAVRKITDS